MLSSLASAKDLPIPIIFSGIAIAETAGSFIGATVFTGVFTRTLEFHGIGRGAPFFISAVSIKCVVRPSEANELDRFFILRF